MKYIVSLLLLLASLIPLQAADGIKTVLLTANTVSNLLSGPYIVNNITILATTTNVTTVKFYDTSNTTTTIVTSAYTQYSGYATNFSNVFTNEASVLVTNSYSGWYTVPVAVAAATNSRPIFYTIMAPGSSITSKDLRLGTLTGLAAVPDQDCTVAITYTGNP